ncbi:4-alpha-glucanotransferase [Ruminococcaceae bacterium KH2T8]|nr:4-alpha-glucanotransferase [Ruminococcaceae bacterium KH2T8]
MFFHASRSSEYRTPFGARPTGSDVQLYFDTPADVSNVTLCYTYGLYGFSYHEEPMCLIDKKADRKRYQVSIMLPIEPGLLFYWFKFRDTEDRYSFYVAEADTKLGSGKVYSEPPRVGADEDKYPYAWQITVYDKDFVTPERMKGAMIYQIFPDRFSRDRNFDIKALTDSCKREERIYHKDWYEDVDIEGKPSTGYLACDFFGGSLRGITEKLDYLKAIGIDILYLNPIFEARSSHRYDTADYLNVDPILGGNEAFDELQREARSRGITLIIDGVFSHTGADSKYFNKFGRYEGIGAYKSYLTGEESQYRSWYNFFRTEDGEVAYDSWWGFPDLPNVNENSLSYRKFVFGAGGIVDTWTSRGAGGIRLDVSDELPDSFIRQMRTSLKSYTDGEGILVGEVWEDASNKCSYGSYRDFMLGRTHDSVMGYTFRKCVLDFLCGYISAEVFDSRMEGFRERYPMQAYYCIMNLISSHDVPRAYTMFSKPADVEGRELQQKISVPDEMAEECERLMRMAYAIQIGYIGAACVYYGDEILMDGYKDPFNRRTYPWGKLTGRQNEELLAIQELSKLRVENPVLRTGLYETLLAEDDVMAFRRFLDEDRVDAFGKQIDKGSEEVILILNRSHKLKCFHVEGNKVKPIKTSPVPTEEKMIVPYDGRTSFDISLAPDSFVFLVKQ